LGRGGIVKGDSGGNKLRGKSTKKKKVSQPESTLGGNDLGPTQGGIRVARA